MRRLGFALAIGIATVGLACNFSTPPPALTPTALAAIPTATTTATPTATIVPTATPEPPRCIEVAARLSATADAVAEAMDGYEGTWGFALVDIECRTEVERPPGYRQYPASAGKIVPIIATLRAVDDGRVAFDDIADDLEQAVTISSDLAVDALATHIAPKDVEAVLSIAGVSESTSFASGWRHSVTTPLDLARVWSAVLMGDVLETQTAAVLLSLAGRAGFPAGFGYETFPESLGVPGLAYGQKAGYWVSPDEPDDFVGAGFIQPVGGGPPGFSLVLMVETDEDDVREPQRRSVFPILVEFILGEMGIATDE